MKTGGGCWICGSASARIYKSRSYDRRLTPADFEITDSRYGLTLALRQCQDCGFIYADDPQICELEGLYEQLENPGYEHSQESRAYQMQWLLQRTIRLRPRAKTLLDIGAGAGLLVRQARELGFDATGIEPSYSLAQSARRINGVEILRGFFPHPETDHRHFDIITVIDVIEHVSDPMGLLRNAADALAPDGVLLVVTPDVSSLAARLFRQRWWHFRLAHVGYFTRDSLLRAAEGAGLHAVKVYRPRWFFQIDYLAVRLQRYLPVESVNRLLGRVPVGRWLYRRIVPVNPRDSVAIFLEKSRYKIEEARS